MTKSKGEFLPFWDIHLHWKNQNEPLINSSFDSYLLDAYQYYIRKIKML